MKKELKEIYNQENIFKLLDKNSSLEELNEEAIKKYINTYIELIIKRTDLLYKSKKI